MSWLTLKTCETVGNANAFLTAVSIWINRPNVCNKIISCAKIEERKEIHSTAKNNQAVSLPGHTLDFCSKILAAPIICPFCNAHINQESLDDAETVLRKLVPRNDAFYQSGYELVVKTTQVVYFIPLHFHKNLPNSDYAIYAFLHHACTIKARISFRIILSSFGSSSSVKNETGLDKIAKPTKFCFASPTWLEEKLLPSIYKWSNEEMNKLSTESMDFPVSLSLVDKEKYTILYQNLKKKYGYELSKMWPEVTDPQKYVYEDIAIAAYLLILWQNEREMLGKTTPQSFIDLGCGNGLLVYILNSEQHPGKGVDIRKRHVWDILSNANLEEAVVTPDDLSLVQGYDWLLGNHSDELTPWIPVMASRCSYNTRYWVLPCCFFDFYNKFERSQSTTGQYRDYLNFVCSVGKICGFEVHEDVMRIPSTKRVCYVGMSKNYPEENHQLKQQGIETYVKSRCNNANLKTLSFVPRPKMEKVQNCTKMDRNIQRNIVDTVVNKLLSVTNIKEIKNLGKCWNKGGILPLSNAVELLDTESRVQLKKECGGLQTLLRNYHQIFEVKGGNVELRDWSCKQIKKKKKNKNLSNAGSAIKTKQCWFFNNHPDGCPRTDVNCTFIHGNK